MKHHKMNFTPRQSGKTESIIMATMNNENACVFVRKYAQIKTYEKYNAQAFASVKDVIGEKQHFRCIYIDEYDLFDFEYKKDLKILFDECKDKSLFIIKTSPKKVYNKNLITIIRYYKEYNKDVYTLIKSLPEHKKEIEELYVNLISEPTINIEVFSKPFDYDQILGIETNKTKVQCDFLSDEDLIK